MSRQSTKNKKHEKIRTTFKIVYTFLVLSLSLTIYQPLSHLLVRDDATWIGAFFLFGMIAGIMSRSLENKFMKSWFKR